MRNLTQAGLDYVESIRKFAGKSYSQKRIPANRLLQIEEVLQTLQPLLVESVVQEEQTEPVEEQIEEIRTPKEKPAGRIVRRKNRIVGIPTAV